MPPGAGDLCLPGRGGRQETDPAPARTYFEHRGIQTDLSIVYADVYNTRAMVERFRSLFQDHPGCVVDITGGTDAVLFACGLACEGTQISVITYSRRNNRFYEIRNADYANQLNCAISFSVEDTFLMAGGRLKKGRVDNAGLSRYLDLIDPFFRYISTTAAHGIGS